MPYIHPALACALLPCVEQGKGCTLLTASICLQGGYCKKWVAL